MVISLLQYIPKHHFVAYIPTSFWNPQDISIVYSFPLKMHGYFFFTSYFHIIPYHSIYLHISPSLMTKSQNHTKSSPAASSHHIPPYPTISKFQKNSNVRLAALSSSCSRRWAKSAATRRWEPGTTWLWEFDHQTLGYDGYINGIYMVYKWCTTTNINWYMGSWENNHFNGI